jgi:hypothetical protein
MPLHRSVHPSMHPACRRACRECRWTSATCSDSCHVREAVGGLVLSFVSAALNLDEMCTCVCLSLSLSLCVCACVPIYCSCEQTCICIMLMHIYFAHLCQHIQKCTQARRLDHACTAHQHTHTHTVMDVTRLFCSAMSRHLFHVALRIQIRNPCPLAVCALCVHNVMYQATRSERTACTTD